MEKEKRPKFSKASFQKALRVFAFMRPYRGVYWIGWIFLVFSSITAMLFPALMGQLLGTGQEENPLIDIEGLNMNDVTTILLVMLVVFGFQALFSFVRILTFNYVTENTLRDIRLKSFQRLIHLPVDFYNRNKVGELTSRIATDIQLMQETLNTTIAEFFRQIISILIAAGFIFYLSWELALWMLSVIPVLAIVAIIFGRYIRGLSKKAQEESAHSNSILQEALSGIFNVKAFNNENFETNRYQTKINNVLASNIRSGLMRGLFVSFIIFCIFGGVAFVIWKAKMMEYNGEITNQAFNAFILFTIFLGASFASIPDLYAKILKAIGSTEHLMDLIEEPLEEPQELKSLSEFDGNLTFKEVQFSYPQRKEINVLNAISFDCRSGEVIALVGSSGAGKSTIASLILKMYEPTAGAIYFDQKDIKEISAKSLRKYLAVVPQEVMLFNGTIRENILFGNIEATEEAIIEAAKSAFAYDFIMQFPDQFETIVGDRGIQLSGGQRQRIAIARAMLKQPKLLILDEATSALDSESEKYVQQALQNLMKGRTSIVIAHRLSTIQKADQILVLENGIIKERGKHEELLQQNGLYTKMISLQRTNEYQSNPNKL